MATKQEQKKVFLECTVREAAGTDQARQLRRQGWVPAVLYGAGEPAVPICVSAKELMRVLHTKAGENALITLKIEGEGGKEPAVLIKDLQHHPVTHDVIHADFYRVSLTKKIKVEVPLKFRGEEEAVGVKQEGGVLEHIRREVEVECLPTDIPSEIEVDIGGLKMNDTLHVRDLAVPPGVEVVTEPDQPVVACVPPRVEEEKPEEEAAEGKEPEVLKQKGEGQEAEAAPGKGGEEKKAALKPEAEKKGEKPEGKEKKG